VDPTFRREILDILSGTSDLTIATLREDGYPQATTVSYANDDLEIYFGTCAGSQKAKNLGRNPRVSATVNLPYRNWSEIRGLSMSGKAERLTDRAQIARAGELLQRKFSQAIAQYASVPLGDIAFFRVRPELISMLDYRKGFGHTDLVECSSRSAPAGALIRASWPDCTTQPD
jgi:general stress protein 26